MRYSEHSIEHRLLQNDPDAVGQVIRWISAVLMWPRFWPLREEWPDLMQESLAAVVESLRNGRFEPSRDLYFYVQGIARHIALRALKAAGRRAGMQTAVLAESRSNPGPSGIDPVAVRQALRRIMDGASEECRFLMRAYYLEEKSYEEIAADLDAPVGTVKSRLFRCVESSQKALRVVVRRRTAVPAE